MATYSTFQGSTLEYSTTDGGVKVAIAGVKASSDKGSTPATVDATTLDETEQRIAVKGLQDVQQITYDFNMDTPDADSNIQVAYTAAGLDQILWFYETYANGLVLSYSGEPSIIYTAGAVDEVTAFQMVVTVSSEIATTFPPSV